MNGPGDYEYSAPTNHPNDPRNDDDEYGGNPLEDEARAREEHEGEIAAIEELTGR